MALDHTTAHETIQSFLQKWPIERLRDMSIQQYADLSKRQEAFCYWMEYDSRDVGELGGMPLTKFGLWKYVNRKDYSETYLSDDTYAWNSKYGTRRTDAFLNIREIIIKIAILALANDWQAIELVEFHSIAKWKIAFMYSKNQLLPVYARAALLKIAAGLGHSFSENTAIIDLQFFILSKKDPGEDTVAYAQYLLEHYVKGKPFRNYFIVGSKYKDEEGNDTKDVFPTMLQTSTIAIGFLSDHDMTPLLSAPDHEIDKFVADNCDEQIKDVAKIQKYFRILLRLKPGDIVAVKAFGAYDKLKIIAYAIVVNKNGHVYKHNSEKLGHHINVEYVETNISRDLVLNYPGTIHHISPEKIDHLPLVFGPFLQVDNIALGSESDDELPSILGSDSKYKSEETFTRGPVAERMVRQLHNIIQNSFFKFLKVKYPNHTIKIEYERRIDLVRESADEIWYYEIKPFENVMACLREAIGQLLEYSYRFPTDKKMKLVIVGPGELIGDALSMYYHFQESINLDISYEHHIVPNRQD